jgi:hypothetical protein
VNDKVGTRITATEWWNDDYCFTTFQEVVLDKHKNEFFNYEEGKPNHFAKPKKPYTFLSVFSLGEQPHDITGLIEQNIPNQNLVTRRTLQIDRNLNKANNSIGLSAANFNQQTGKQAAAAMEAGDPVLIPSGGPVSEAIARFPAQAVPDAFFNDLRENKEALRSSFGTQGITSQQPTEDTTARGMILNQQFDNTRIGGGIGDALAQVADNVFNWWVQLYYVFYDEEHYAAIMGAAKATEYVTLSNQSFHTKLIISVAADSMKPHDEITEMNQAMNLWTAGAIDPQTLLTILNVPNPKETAGQAVLWKIDPMSYMKLNFPELSQQMQQLMMQQSQQDAQTAGMNAQAEAAGTAAGTPVPQESPPTTGSATANPSLQMVGLPK